MRRIAFASLVLAPVIVYGLSTTHVTGKEVVVTAPQVRYQMPVPSKLLEQAVLDTTTTEPPPSTTIAVKHTVTTPTTIRHTTPVVIVSRGGWTWPWSCISHYESGGNPADDTGNGYYGGLQFSLSTWYAHGGTGMPNQASIAEQEAIANNVVAADHGSYREWPNTARDCGLPVF